MSTDKTLADVQPGGRVRLGDGLPPLPKMEHIGRVVGMGPHDTWYEPVAYTAEQMLDYARAALSAQPSPGGQGDAESALRKARLALAEQCEWGSDKRACLSGELDSSPAMKALTSAFSALAARQPVGELHLPPDGFYKIVFEDAEVPDESFARSGALDAALRRFEQISNKWNAHLFVRFANNTRDCTVPNATPAQAVDLGAVREAVRKAWQKCAAGESVDFQFGTLLALIDSKADGNG